ncbi:MAG TPA: glycosyl transferase family 2 [Gammaproteobacteria bacterium]|nr:glycosyl transferase family 2 [Gammaproteobacteria bacterium]
MQKFFILTPCLNATRYIDDTVLSVISQIGDFSVYYHVQDGGSSDGTVNKLERWSEIIASGSCPQLRNDISFSYSSLPDSGIYDAINNGFSHKFIHNSDGIMMTWINAGDRLEQGALQTVSRLRQTNPSISWLSGGFAQINDEGSVIASTSGGTPVSQVAMAAGLYEGRLLGFMQQEGVFWASGLWKQSGGVINKALKLAGDFDLWRQFSKHAPCYKVNTITGCFRRHESGLSSNIERYYKEIDTLLEGGDLDMRDRLVRKLHDLSDRRDGNGMIQAGFTGPVVQWDVSANTWEIKMSIINPQRPSS